MPEKMPTRMPLGSTGPLHEPVGCRGTKPGQPQARPAPSLPPSPPPFLLRRDGEEVGERRDSSKRRGTRSAHPPREAKRARWVCMTQYPAQDVQGHQHRILKATSAVIRTLQNCQAPGNFCKPILAKLSSPRKFLQCKTFKPTLQNCQAPGNFWSGRNLVIVARPRAFVNLSPGPMSRPIVKFREGG